MTGVADYDGAVQTETETWLERGDAALRIGDWAAAASAFQEAWDAEPLPEAGMGLGIAQWWQGQTARGLLRIEEATQVFLARPDLYQAAKGMLRLAFHQAEHMANPELASSWLRQAAALLEEHAIEPLQGELELVRSLLSSDLQEGERLALEAMNRARSMGDPDLELAALARMGALRVAQGHTQEGLERLQEALTAGLAGEAHRSETLALASCLMARAAAQAADHIRALQWVRWIEQFAEQHRSPIHHALAATVYGRVLVATGAWDRGEEVLTEAVKLTEDLVPTYHADAVVGLAELRLARGQLAEAERLLHGLDAQPGVLPPLARARLMQGRATTAVAMVERRLHVIGREALESSELVEILGEAELMLGAFDSAARHARTLVELGRRRSCPTIAARGARLLGRATHGRDLEAAVQLLETSIEVWRKLGLPYERARTQLQLGTMLRSQNLAEAEDVLRAAVQALDTLGAVPEADEGVALLAQLGVQLDHEGRRSQMRLTPRELEVLRSLGDGLSNSEIASKLFLSLKTVEHHVASVLTKLRVQSRAEAAAQAEQYQSE